jgi:hypothetical protein
MARGKLHTEVAEALDDAISGAKRCTDRTLRPKMAPEVRRQGFEPRTR